ncbi:MAG: proline iminopeptidase-family hydrolase [Cyclobacteriaceae bacterium]|nr:proline iminopeptidase-family hydrolase [Cyclobacteriaceae bacterium]
MQNNQSVKTQYGKILCAIWGDGPKKIILNHGGPGLTHEYFANFTDHLPSDFQVIAFDQIGSFHSDKPEDPSTITIGDFTVVLEDVINALDIDNCYLLGHSLGASVAMEYSAKFPEKVNALVLSNMMTDIDEYEKYTQHLFENMPEEAKQEFTAMVNAGDFANPRFAEWLQQYWYGPHMCRTNPWPQALLDSMQHIALDGMIPFTGPNPFQVQGKLKEWSFSDRLSQLRMPCLVIGSEYDSMDPRHLRKMAEALPNSEYHHCPKGSHFAMWDDEETYFEGLNRFLAKV